MGKLQQPTPLHFFLATVSVIPRSRHAVLQTRLVVPVLSLTQYTSRSQPMMFRTVYPWVKDLPGDFSDNSYTSTPDFKGMVCRKEVLMKFPGPK